MVVLLDTVTIVKIDSFNFVIDLYVLLRASDCKHCSNDLYDISHHYDSDDDYVISLENRLIFLFLTCFCILAYLGRIF